MNRKEPEIQKKNNRNKKNSHQKTALSRIAELFIQAEQVHKTNPELADRYVQLAKKISLKYKVPFSKQQKMDYCKGCSRHIFETHNKRIRTNKAKIVILCKNCGTIARFKYK